MKGDFDMTKKMLLISIVTTSWIFNGCGINEAGEPSTILVSESDNFSFSITEASTSGVILEVVNHAEDTLYWGNGYTLEENINNAWYTIEPMVLEEAVSITHDIKYELGGDERRTWELQWGEAYSLQEGHYRIVKEFYYDDRNYEDMINVACEFDVK